MSTTTTNLGLAKPATGDRYWGATMNSNLDLIDAVLAGASAADATATVVFHTGTTHGTQLGGAATDLLAFWGAAPTARPAGAEQAAVSVAAVGATNSADRSSTINANFAALQTLANGLRAALVTAGLIKGSA